MGIDVGSTTAKVVVLDAEGAIAFSSYERHHARSTETVREMVSEARERLGDSQVELLVTGSAGLGLCERFGLPYVQEVIASVEFARRRHPQVRTLIDIGGEDAKMVFLSPDGMPDIRMNGSCAGGTGSYIDEMSNLLDVSVAELSELAERHETIHAIASRCGVFGKTDVQNLLSRRIPLADVAASIFHAVAIQTTATLSRGYDVVPDILLGGGPLTFLPALRAAIARVLGLGAEQFVATGHGELLPALGAALAEDKNRLGIALPALSDRLAVPRAARHVASDRLPALFESAAAAERWAETRTSTRIGRVSLDELNGSRCFLGIDSGSTTTKAVLIDEDGRIAFDHYANNRGDAIGAARIGLRELDRKLSEGGVDLDIARTAVTGYGEDLIRAAYGIDDGIVETLAHYHAARTFDPDVTFVLDIGGQDMKAIFVREGHVQNIEINEACSSGCGSFIESFANAMGYEVADFAHEACLATAPCDLGTRCTVFMNSKVKQALREGAEVRDISAGLAYSVIKNALHKVLGVTNVAVLGDNIVVQGGTFRNPAIHRAIETLLGVPVVCPEIAELMGAYGAALTARAAYRPGVTAASRFVGLDGLDAVSDYERRTFLCKGCENRCSVTKLIFANKNTFFTGNRCERIISNRGERRRSGANLPAIKNRLLFDRVESRTATPTLTLGIPRVMNMFDNYPFWHALLVESGFRVVLSAPSTTEIYDKGAGTLASENICFPAKLAHGHVLDLVEAGVDRIFYPMVFYEQREFEDATECYTCPIVAGYPDVLRSAIDPDGRYGIPLDSPTIAFGDRWLLMKSCFEYLRTLGVGLRTFRRAFTRAEAAQREYRCAVRAEGARILGEARDAGRPVIVMMGRPYHVDPRINHKLPDMLCAFGVDVITEDAVPMSSPSMLDNPHALAHWSYTNRTFHAARWAGEQHDVEVVQLNSFACGPDAFSLAEVHDILSSYGKGHTVIRVDEIESTGSAKLRLRSMIEVMNGVANCPGWTGGSSTAGAKRHDRTTPSEAGPAGEHEATSEDKPDAAAVRGAAHA
jgi:predicted CoA-substrate-specific enzyme activase